MSKAHKEYDAQFKQIKQVGVIVAFQEPLVSADAIARYIKSRARLTKPMADLLYKIQTDLDRLMDQMDQENQEQIVRMEDAWGTPEHVKLVPNYRSIENTPEWRRDNQSEQGF